MKFVFSLLPFADHCVDWQTIDLIPLAIFSCLIIVGKVYGRTMVVHGFIFECGRRLIMVRTFKQRCRILFKSGRYLEMYDFSCNVLTVLRGMLNVLSIHYLLCLLAVLKEECDRTKCPIFEFL